MRKLILISTFGLCRMKSTMWMLRLQRSKLKCQLTLRSLAMGVKSVQISELGEIVSGGTPKSSNPEYWGGDVYWATPTDITKTSNKEISDTETAFGIVYR